MIITWASFLERETFLIFSCLILVALAALLSEFSGVINIALEGQLVTAVFSFMLFNFGFKAANLSPVIVYLLSFGLAVLAVLGFTMLFTFLAVTFNINKILVALALNIVISGIASFAIILIRDYPFLQAANGDYLILYANDAFNAYVWTDLPVFIHVFVVAGLIGAVHFFIYFTTTGLRIRAAGESVKVSRIMGLNPSKYRYIAMALGAILITFAGLFFTEAQSDFGGSVNGYGYIALALLNIGNRNVFLITIFTFLFAMLQTLAVSAVGTTYVEIYRAGSYFIPIVLLMFYGIYLTLWKQTKIRVPHELTI